MALPAYQYPGNALLNFAPISEAIDSNRQNALMQRRADMEQERLGMERKRLGMAEQSHASAQEDAIRKRIGGQALLALQDADEGKRAAIHQQILASHPNAANLPAHYRDPKTGLLAIVGDAGMADDYIRFQIQKQQAARAAEPDIVRTLEAAGYKKGTPEFQEVLRTTIKGQSPLDQARAQVLQQVFPGIGGQQTPQAQGQPRVIPQSYEGSGDPQLIPTQATTPAPAAPPQQPPNVFGNLTPQQRVGVGMAIAGMGDAGKIIAEAGNAGQLGKEGMNQIDKAIVDKVMDLGDLQQIQAAYNKNYLGLGGQAKALAAKWQDWLAGGIKDPQQKEFFAGYSRFATATTERLNNRIKALSGAAVSEAEAKRMYAANPTTSDGPDDFENKLKQQFDMNRMAVARYNWLRREYRGTPEDIAKLAQSGRIESFATLDDMKKIYSDRSSAIEQQLRQQNPQLPPAQIDAMRRKALKGEFGI